MATDMATYDPRLGLAGESIQLFIEALQLLEHDYTNLHTDSIAMLRLWANGFNSAQGELDDVLESSREMEEAVYVVLYDLIKTIGKCKASAAIHLRC